MKSQKSPRKNTVRNFLTSSNFSIGVALDGFVPRYNHYRLRAQRTQKFRQAVGRRPDATVKDVAATTIARSSVVYLNSNETSNLPKLRVF